MTKAEHVARQRLKKATKSGTAAPQPSSSTSADDRRGASFRLDCASIFLYVLVPTVIALLTAYFYYQDSVLKRISTPADLPRVEVHDAQDLAERYWGTYRPGVYFGTTYRSHRAFATGLMWFEQFQPGMPQVRHQCDQGDRLPKYGWLKHDGRRFGIQEIDDTRFVLRTEFLKQPRNGTAGDWTARITVRPKDDALPTSLQPVVSLLYYVVDDSPGVGTGRFEPVLYNGKLTGLQGDTGDGDASEAVALGRRFRIDFKGASATTPKHDHLITYIEGRQLVKDVTMVGMNLLSWSHGRQYVALKGRLVPKDSPGPNTFIYQITGALPLSLEVSFRSGVEEAGSPGAHSPATAGDAFDAELARHSRAFDEQFEATFGLAARGYPASAIGAARAALSNMVGGIGYFSGASRVQSRRHREPVESWPAELYTGVPSRSFFPRGFLWDEGFHNLLISRWDERISRDIIGHWLNLANVDGWIAREQILGDEARSRVPDEFVVQRDENANPPTLFLPLQSIVRRLVAAAAGGAVSATDAQFLRELFPRLRLWYGWFNSSQAGAEFSAYRWRGRNASAARELNPKTLTSGLDDYPRASHPTDDERHVDLRCWVALASAVMADVARAVGEPSAAVAGYEATRDALFDNDLLDRLHWSESSRRYADYGLHTDAVRLQEPPPPKHLQPGQRAPPREKVRVAAAEPSHQLVAGYYGYVSLFPLLLRVLDASSPRLGAVLDDLRRDDLLWTSYGLRSLAKKSPLYGKRNTEHDPPYWRGAIWINMNYLAVSALHHYGSTEGPHRERARRLYEELRGNVVGNVLREYARTGYVWEQYDDATGSGKGSHPFTGWSALFTLMMAELY